MKIGILGTGSYVPEKILTNDDLSKIVETNDEWIRTRTGIEERRIAAPDEATSDLSYKASEKAIEDAGIDKNEIELVIVATMTPDHAAASTAAVVQNKLGINAAAFDLSALQPGLTDRRDPGASAPAAGLRAGRACGPACGRDGRLRPFDGRAFPTAFRSARGASFHGSCLRAASSSSGP